MTCSSTPHFFVGDMRRIWNMDGIAYVLYGEETSTGRVSPVKKFREYVHIVKSNLGLQTDGRSPDVTV